MERPIIYFLLLLLNPTYSKLAARLSPNKRETGPFELKISYFHPPNLLHQQIIINHTLQQFNVFITSRDLDLLLLQSWDKTLLSTIPLDCDNTHWNNPSQQITSPLSFIYKWICTKNLCEFNKEINGISVTAWTMPSPKLVTWIRKWKHF